MKPKIIEIRKNVLNKNDKLAQKLRASFAGRKVFVVNVVSSPGSGKTELLKKLLKLMIERGLRVGAIVGDLATENDAKRLAESGAKVYQINTYDACHLDASMVERALAHFDLQALDFLFIENIGNLVCPASYDLGENIRMVLMAVTEGEDKPLKYPTMFRSADLCVITKMDLAKYVDFDEKTTVLNMKKISPRMKILTSSAKKDEGLEEIIEYLSHKAPCIDIGRDMC